jgi:exodeoxyribonuclease VII large subunit
MRRGPRSEGWEGRSSKHAPGPRPARLGQSPQDPVPVELAVKVAARELERRLDRPIWFSGELVQLTASRGGHAYAVLRGSGAKIDVFVPATHARQSGGLATGTVVVVHGRLRIWQPGGRFEIAAASALLPTASVGARANAREASERQLRAEGVLDRLRRDLPRWPVRVAVVTSGRGAAIEDVRATINRRAAWVAVHLHDCTVQGAGAVSSIITALDAADRSAADLVILTRGGGAPDTLDPFNDVGVVRRVAASRLPTIVAVGHESDRTLADLVADRSTSTPTSAAELAVPDGEAIRREMRDHRRGLHAVARATCSAACALSDHCTDRCRQALRQRVRLLRERLRRVEPRALSALLARLFNSERRHLATARANLRRDARGVVRESRRRLWALRPEVWVGHGEATIRADRHRATELIRAIEALSPEHVLERGYALVLGRAGCTIRSSGDVEPGEALQIMLRDGTVAAVVVAMALSDQSEEYADDHDGWWRQTHKRQ